MMAILMTILMAISMDNLALTLIAAVILMGLVIAGLGLGLILTGKSRLKRGCGLTPNPDKKTPTCPICGDNQSCKENDDDNDNRE